MTTSLITPPIGPARFPLGDIYSTPGALEILERYQVNPLLLLGRHLSGDWGDVSPEDAQANEDAVHLGDRILSSYRLPPPVSGEVTVPATVWLITEADRSLTTLLLPAEY